ncbi:MAG: hypothetical protein R3A78_15730 [Polyangiales bacterium]|nr:hypothetical protein [Myxococcales bacterium]
MSRDSHERIKPATPNVVEAEAAGYRPKLPWKWIGLFGGAIVLFSLLYWLNERKESEALRGEIVARFDQGLAPAVERYRTFRERIDGLVLEAAKENPPAKTVDPRLEIAALHKGDGIYLRIPATAAADDASIQSAAHAMAPDAITRCLGIAPTSLKGFYDQGAFLMPAWLDEAKTTTSRPRLRVLASDLGLRIARDLPGLLKTTRAQYFLLALERGESRSESPVDVFLWDLSSGKRLLSVRTEPTGELLAVRIAGAARVARDGQTGSAGADCGIAAQVKELAGEPTMGDPHGESPTGTTAPAGTAAE